MFNFVFFFSKLSFVTKIPKIVTKIHFRAIGAAAITALRSANYQSTLEEALQVYEIEIVILVLKRCRTLAICHVFFAFW